MSVTTPSVSCRSAATSLIKKRVLLLVAGSISFSSAISFNASPSLLVCSAGNSVSCSEIVGSNHRRFPGLSNFRRMEVIILFISLVFLLVFVKLNIFG